MPTHVKVNQCSILHIVTTHVKNIEKPIPFRFQFWFQNSLQRFTFDEYWAVSRQRGLVGSWRLARFVVGAFAIKQNLEYPNPFRPLKVVPLLISMSYCKYGFMKGIRHKDRETTYLRFSFRINPCSQLGFRIIIKNIVATYLYWKTDIKTSLEQNNYRSRVFQK